MAWETRGNRKYYYESSRGPDGRVRKTYYGAGRAAEQAAEAAARQRREREEYRELVVQAAALRDLNELIGDVTGSMVEAELRARGFHNHKGAWRRRHG